jgi:tetratricopeptide (TPR) repeat protein
MKILHIIVLLITIALTPSVSKADQSDPRLDKLFFNLKVNADLGLSQQLISEIWRIWSEHNKKDINILFNSGENAMYKKDYETALESFNKIVELAPDFAEGWNKRATVYFLMGDYHASLADIEKTLRLEPRHFGALAGQGQCYFELQKFQSALNAFEKALAVNPWLYDVYRNMEIMKKLLDQQT